MKDTRGKISLRLSALTNVIGDETIGILRKIEADPPPPVLARATDRRQHGFNRTNYVITRASELTRGAGN